jgi:hypothetical protein
MVTLSQKELQRMRVIEKAVNAKCSASNAVTGPTPLPSRHSLAGKVAELSHQLDGSLRFYFGQQLLLTRQRPPRELIEPKPAILSSALKRKPKPPRIYNLGGRPALSAAT